MPEFKRGEKFRRRFTILAEIAPGLSGYVYKARDETDGSMVALKILDPRSANRESMTVASYFSNEPVLLKAIRDERRHPHIVEYVAHASDQIPHYLATRYIDGFGRKGLEDLLGRPLPPGFVLRVVSQIGNALDYLHFGHQYYSPIIHRDVKPRNILIDRNGDAVLIDLSIAAYQGHKVARPHLLLTWRYSAPEQHTGKEVPASDQFALAMIVFQMLSGEALLPQDAKEGRTALQRLDALMQSGYAPVKEKLRSLPNTVAALIKALQLNPANRYATCEEFAMALRQGMQKDQVNLTSIDPPRTLVLSWSLVVLVVLVVSASLLLALAIFLTRA